MYQFVYMSCEVRAFSTDDLRKLLEGSRQRNEACGITGILLYANGNFIQLLEGEPQDVHAIVSRIRADPRHRDMNTLLEGHCAKREFEDWSMGFKRVEDTEAEKLSGFNNFLRGDNDKSMTCSRAMRLLEFFRELTR